MALKSHKEVWENTTHMSEGHTVCGDRKYIGKPTSKFPTQKNLEQKQLCEHQRWNQDYMDYFYKKDERPKYEIETINLPSWLPYNNFIEERKKWTGLWRNDLSASYNMYIGKEPTIPNVKSKDSTIKKAINTPVIEMKRDWQEQLSKLGDFQQKCAIALLRSGTSSNFKVGIRNQLEQWLDKEPKDTGNPQKDKWKPFTWEKSPLSQRQWDSVCVSNRWGSVGLKTYRR